MSQLDRIGMSVAAELHPAGDVWGQNIRWWNFVRLMRTDFAFNALFLSSERNYSTDSEIWDMACANYASPELEDLFETILSSGDFSFTRLSTELHLAVDPRRDPDPDMDFASVSAACKALCRLARKRMSAGDFSWPPIGEGRGWHALTDALLLKMVEDGSQQAIELRLAFDLGL